ncbi:hypothetical protein [Streptomyces sp. NPDC058254]|uniref:hypothetical protein n=1 Tax=Streptomyces sp. NPDC058254 TaxID=3346406 RepID=UPI0036EE5230
MPTPSKPSKSRTVGGPELMHAHGHQDVEGAASASTPEDPLTEARRLLDEDEAARMQACAEDLQAVLAKHGMRLEVAPSQISIVPAQ